ncbi:MAG: EAL domain-containing protein [Pseudomonadota bacterium]
MKTRQLRGFEALARWRGEDGVARPRPAPEPALEDPGRGAQISEAILSQAISGAAAWSGSPGVWTSIASPAEALTLELTERVLLSRHTKVSKSHLDALRRRGVRIAFEDFGAGYAWLTRPPRFPVDELKLDRSFITPLNCDREASLARTRKLDTVAEGVEDGTTHRILRNIGCKGAQRHHYGRPVPAEEAALFRHDADAARARSSLAG